ncbi:MAG: NAD(P)/FAD-dependent oxidoreductase [Candidatus Methanomethylicia archaeon]
MRSYDVCVVGGGFSGLYFSSIVDGEVHIFEEHSKIGLPLHCAGIISPRTFKLLGIPWRFVEAKYDGMVINFDGYKLFWSGNPLVLKVDRVGIEEYFYDICLSRGHTIHFNNHVSNVDPRGFIFVDDLKFESKIIILAEGFKRFFSKFLGLIDYGDDFFSLQAMVKCRVNVDNIHVYIESVLSDFFSWFIPLSDDKCIVGVTSKYSNDLTFLMNSMIKRLISGGMISNADINQFFSGIVIRGPVGKPGLGKIFGIGDTIQMNKPLSGGGLYPICLASRELAKLINDYICGRLDFDILKNYYTKFFRGFSRPLSSSYKLSTLAFLGEKFLLKNFIKGFFKLDGGKIFDLDYDDPLSNLLRSPGLSFKLLSALLFGLLS